jgi:hypothetical protein
LWVDCDEGWKYVGLVHFEGVVEERKRESTLLFKCTSSARLKILFMDGKTINSEGRHICSKLLEIIQRLQYDPLECQLMHILKRKGR